MRLVWVVIPLVLIGIIGVQNADGVCAPGGDPGVPCLDQPIGSWYEYIPREPFELQKDVKVLSFGDIPTHFRIFDIEDSRCPSDVQCVWEGQVVVHVDVTVNWEQLGIYSISLNEPLDGSLIQLDQYYLQLLKVEPYPDSIKSLHDSDYVVTMKFISKTLSPLKQVSNGVSPENIVCKEELELIFKSSDNSPACVKPETAEKLIERGWLIDENTKLLDLPEPSMLREGDFWIINYDYSNESFPIHSLNKELRTIYGLHDHQLDPILEFDTLDKLLERNDYLKYDDDYSVVGNTFGLLLNYNSDSKERILFEKLFTEIPGVTNAQFHDVWSVTLIL